MGDFRENLLLTLSNDFIVNKKCTEQYARFIDVVYEHQLFACEKSVPEVIRQMHDALNSSKSRLEGLCLLQQLLLGCSQDVYEQHALVWAKLLLQIIQSYGSKECHQLTCGTLASLLSHGKCSAELSREFATSVIPPVVTTLLECKEQWRTEALQCLCSCMMFFPGPCGPFKNKIENMVLPLMECNEDVDLIEAAVECFSLLPHCGGRGRLGVKHSEAWTEETNRVLATLHKTLTLLYCEIEGDSYESAKESSLPLSTVSDIEPAHSFALLTRLDMLCRLLECLLTGGMGVAVQLPLHNLLHFICRVLNVSPKMLMLKVTKEDMLLASLLPQLHTIALKLLSSVITCAHSHMVRHSGTVNQLFVQTLGWSSTDIQLGQVTLYSGLRKQLYSSVSTWLQTVSAASGIESISDDLLSHILHDSSPLQQVFMVKSVARKSESANKKRHHTASTATATSCGQLQLDSTGRQQVTEAALGALHQLILTTGCFLRPKLHKAIQELVVPLLAQISANPLEAPAPYDSAPCRLALYHVLRDCVLCTSSAWPAPTSCAIVTFSAGQRDHNLQVSTFCRESLLICESIIHPRAPSFSAPLLRASVISGEDVVDATQVPSTPPPEKVIDASQVLSTSPTEKIDEAVQSASNPCTEELIDTMQSTSNGVSSHFHIATPTVVVPSIDDASIGQPSDSASIKPSNDNDELEDDMPSCSTTDAAPFEGRHSSAEETVVETSGGTSEVMPVDVAEKDTKVELMIAAIPQCTTASEETSKEESPCSVSKKRKLSNDDPDHETHSEMNEDISVMLESFKDADPDVL